jgi:hypothetical protein
MNRKWKSVSNLKYGHIFNKMQILILSYKCPDEINEIGRQLCSVERIATMCVMEHEKQLKTQSEYWCPLIMEALKISGYNIPTEWVNIKSDPIIQKYAIELSQINGWTKYAYHLLDTYETKLKVIPNNFNDQMYQLADDWVERITKYK